MLLINQGHPLILLALIKLLLSADECDSSVGDCLGVDHTEGEEENKYSEKLNDLDIATVKNEEKDSKKYENEVVGQNVAAAEEDAAYREMFDKDGRFNRDLAKEYLDKEDYEQVRHVWLEVRTFTFLLMIRWKRLRASKMASIIRFFQFSHNNNYLHFCRSSFKANMRKDSQGFT